MDIYRTEEEQIEAIKRFFKTYGTHVLIVFCVFVAAFFAYQTWTARQQGNAEQASQYYSELLELAAPGKEMTPESRTGFDELFARLMAEHSTSVYASYASLLSAKMQVAEGNLDKAAQALQWVVDAAATPELKALANLRLSRVLFAKGENDKALKLLDAQSAPFASAYEELRGDIYLEMGQADKALAAYTKAKQLKSEKANLDRILEMKIDSLAAADASRLSAGAASDQPQPAQ